MTLPKECSTKDTNDPWMSRVSHALRKLDDRTALNQNSLSRLTCVEKIAKEKYNGRILPRGLALRDILLASIDKVIDEMSQETASSRACQYLELLKQGLSCQEISRELGLSREHVSRVYRRKALELVTSAFLTLVKHSQ